MSRRSLLVLPLAVVFAVVAKRLVPGPLPGGGTLLPSGWRIRPAGRQVTVGTLPLNIVTLSDGSLVVTNNGNAENGLMGVDPATETVTRTRRLRAAWLGLAASGPSGGDTEWASGGGSNRLYRLPRAVADRRPDPGTLADASRPLLAGGLAV